MSKQVYRIDRYTFSDTDAVFFDANIWLYIYGPQGNRYPRYRTAYTLAFRQIRSAKARIFIDVLVLSEFINAYSRFVYNELPLAAKPADFKTFRNSTEFNPIAVEVAKYATRIIEKSEQIESGFASANLREMLHNYKTGEKDFNDQMLAELCTVKNLKLITHDADFYNEDLTIITANQQLFTE